MPIIHPSLPADGDDAIVEPYNNAITAILNVLDGAVDADNIADASVITAKLHDSAVTNVKIADNTIDLGAKTATWDGWINVTDTWAFASASTITVPSDATTKYDIGDFISIVQSSTTKYFRIQGITSTILTVSGTLGSVVANSTITSPRYSKVRIPHSMPASGLDWYQEIGRTNLTAAGDTISVTNLPARKYLKIVYFYTCTGGNVSPVFQFNNDTNPNYSVRYSSNGGTDSSALTQTRAIAGIGGSAQPQQAEFYIVNTTAQEKVITGRGDTLGSAGAGTAPSRLEISGKWANTAAQINRIDLINTDAGDFTIGSELIILGHD